MRIGEKTIKQATSQMEGLMKEHLQDINETYLVMDDEVSIGLKVKIGPANVGVTVASEISFVKEKVKDRSAVSRVDENQTTLSFVGPADGTLNA